MTDHMTLNQITAAIAKYRKLQRSGEITPAQAQRLRELEMARDQCEPRGRKGCWL